MAAMNRRLFLRNAGIAGAGIACAACLGSCGSSANTVTTPTTSNPSASGVDISVDVSSAGGGALQTIGGSYTTQGVLLAHASSGYIALSSACTHEGAALQFRSSGDVYCPRHGSIFALDGSVVQGPARSPLTAYKTSLSGTTLRVTS